MPHIETDMPGIVILRGAASGGASGPAGGDLSGTYPNPSVVWANGYGVFDARYVLKTGDTMTGALVINKTGSAPDLKILRNSGSTPAELRLVNTSSVVSAITFYEVEEVDGGYFIYQTGSMGKGLYAFVLDGGSATQVLGFTKSARSAAVGAIASATGTDSVAIGREASASASLAVAIGPFSAAHSTAAIAVGTYADISGGSSFGLGVGVKTSSSGNSGVIGMGRGGVYLENGTADSVLIGVSSASVTSRSLFLYPDVTVANDDGTDLDFRIEGDTLANLFFVDASADKIGMNTNAPTISGSGILHMAADTFRLDTARTPATSGAAGNAGEYCWDANYFYICIAASTWRRVAHATW